MANRQWPQVRCFKAGFVAHNKCWVCAAKFYRSIGGNEWVNDEQVLAWLDSEEPGNYDLPVGSLEHRVWQCPAFTKEREEFGSRCMNAHICGEFNMGKNFLQAHTSGLFPAWKHPSYRAQPPEVTGAFEWVMRQVGGTVKAKFYTDGSRMDEKRYGSIRFG